MFGVCRGGRRKFEGRAAGKGRRDVACVNIIRRLWAGETVTDKTYFPVESAKLYTRPAEAPLIIAAAMTPALARASTRPDAALSEMYSAWPRRFADHSTDLW